MTDFERLYSNGVVSNKSSISLCVYLHCAADDCSTLQDTGNLSVCSDEGLDMSQRFTEAMFSGPSLDSDAEEMVTGTMETGLTMT
jgi:hypothetical protein